MKSDNILGFINWEACRRCKNDTGDWCSLLESGEKESSEILVVDTEINVVICTAFTENERLVPSGTDNGGYKK